MRLLVFSLLLLLPIVLGFGNKKPRGVQQLVVADKKRWLDNFDYWPMAGAYPKNAYKFMTTFKPTVSIWPPRVFNYWNQLYLGCCESRFAWIMWIISVPKSEWSMGKESFSFLLLSKRTCLRKKYYGICASLLLYWRSDFTDQFLRCKNWFISWFEVFSLLFRWKMALFVYGALTGKETLLWHKLAKLKSLNPVVGLSFNFKLNVHAQMHRS